MNFERSVISTLLLNPVEIHKVNIKPEYFSDHNLGDIFLSIQSLVNRGIDVDLFVVANELGHVSTTDLIEITRNNSSVAKNLSGYVKKIKDDSMLRGLRNDLSSAISEIDEKATAKQVIADLTNLLARFDDVDVDFAYNAKEMMQKTIEHIEDAHELMLSGKMAGITTGIQKMDKQLGGFHNSDLVIVGARPAMGKTSFLLSAAYKAAKKGKVVGIISTEMSVTQLGVRLMSISSGIEASKMRDSNYNDNDWAMITSGTSQLMGLPIFVYDKPVCSVSDIFMQARAWKAAMGLDILYIDYLTRIKPEKSENKTVAIGNIVTDLKSIARTLNIPVICLAQLSRDLEKRPDKVPLMSDLRDSGVIEQEADQILMLYRDHVYNENADPEEANIVVAKNRHGAVFNAKVNFNTKTMEWRDEQGFDDYQLEQ